MSARSARDDQGRLAPAKVAHSEQNRPSRVETWLRGRLAPLIIYPLLALLSFPTVEILISRSGAWTYTHDVFDDGGGLPRLAIAVRDWSAHGVTLWDPYLTGGNAFLGQFALPPYAPDVALAFVVGPYWAFAIWTWVIASVAGMGMHLFLRDSVRLSIWAVLAGSVIAVFCYWHPIYGISMAIFPLLLWLGDRAAQRDRHRRWFVVGAIGASVLALYAGQLQLVILAAPIQLAWTLVTGAGQRRARLGLWFGTWVIAFGLYAPVLITQLVMLPISQRSIWNLEYLYGTGIGHALSVVLAHYRSILVAIPAMPGLDLGDIRYGTVFLGGIGLSLVGIGVATGRRTRAGIFLLALLATIPLFDLAANLAAPFQENLGFLKSFQFVRVRHFFPFALASVAALGSEALFGGYLTTHRRRRWVAVVPAVVLVAVAVQTALAAWIAGVYLRRFDGTPPDVGWLVAAVGLAIGLVGGILLVAGVIRHGARPGGTLSVALVILLVADRAFLASGTPLLGPHIGTFRASLGLTSGQAFLLRQPGIAHQRVLTFGDHANRMAFQGLRQADGYQAIYPLAYHGFFGALIAPGLDESRFEYFHGWGARAYAFEPRVDPELVALVGARWLYVHGNKLPTVPGLVQRFHDGIISVYENTEAFPRAFVVGATHVGRDKPAVLRDLAYASLADLHGTVYTTEAEAAALVRSLPVGESSRGKVVGTPGPAGSATITVDEPDRVEIDVRVDRPAILVLIDTAAPGWVGEVDGRPAAIHTVDGAFRGIAVHPTARHVIIRYEPGFTIIGFVIASISLLGAIIWLWWFVRWRPSARSGPTNRAEAR